MSDHERDYSTRFEEDKSTTVVGNIPEVSVIIPTYNRSHCVGSAIDSILAQNRSDVEIIVIDDGSTDATHAVLENYINRGVITYFRQENRGPSAARNAGIKLSRGKYVCFLDSDDILEPDSIKARLLVIQKYSKIGLVCTDFIKFKIENNTKILSSNILYENKFLNSDVNKYIHNFEDGVYFFIKEISNDLLLIRNFVSIGTVMIPKHVLDSVGTFREDITIGEDIDLWFRIVRKYEIAFIPKCTVAYLSHSSNITNNIPLYYSSTIEVLLNHIKYISDKHTDLTSKIIKKISYYNFTIGYFYYSQGLYEESKKYFLNALYRDPSRVNYYVYAFIACLPIPVIKVMRDIKHKISGNHVSSKECL